MGGTEGSSWEGGAELRGGAERAWEEERWPAVPRMGREGLSCWRGTGEEQGHVGGRGRAGRGRGAGQLRGPA